VNETNKEKAGGSRGQLENFAMKKEKKAPAPKSSLQRPYHTIKEGRLPQKLAQWEKRHGIEGPFIWGS